MLQKSVLIVSLIAFFFWGCGPSTPQEKAAEPEVISPEAAVSEVRQVFEKYVSDWNSANLDGVMDAVASDIVQMPPGTLVLGKAAVGEDWKRHLTENDDRWEPVIADMAAAGNLVFIRGYFTEAWTPRAGGESGSMQGEGIWVFRREASGAWKLVLEQWFDRAPNG